MFILSIVCIILLAWAVVASFTSTSIAKKCRIYHTRAEGYEMLYITALQALREVRDKLNAASL